MNHYQPSIHLTGWLIMVRTVAPTSQDLGFGVADPSCVTFAPLQFMAASSFESIKLNTAGCSTDTCPAIILLPVPNVDRFNFIEGTLLDPMEKICGEPAEAFDRLHVPVGPALYQRLGTFSFDLGSYWEWGNRGNHDVAFHNGSTAYAY
jgi:hypothetical protein